MRRLAQVAEQGATLDQHFAVVRQADLYMGQGLSNAAGTVRLWAVEAHHRCTLRQSVPFVDRHAHPLCTTQQILGNPGTAHGGKTQVPWVEGVLFGSTDQHQQQLRHQDQALRRPVGQAPQQLRHIHPAGAFNP
ncbi:hypothetical protein D3C73_1345410 [compost metagenome]